MNEGHSCSIGFWNWEWKFNTNEVSLEWYFFLIQRIEVCTQITFLRFFIAWKYSMVLCMDLYLLGTDWWRKANATVFSFNYVLSNFSKTILTKRWRETSWGNLDYKYCNLKSPQWAGVVINLIYMGWGQYLDRQTVFRETYGLV